MMSYLADVVEVGLCGVLVEVISDLSRHVEPLAGVLRDVVDEGEGLVGLSDDAVGVGVVGGVEHLGVTVQHVYQDTNVHLLFRGQAKVIWDRKQERSEN